MPLLEILKSLLGLGDSGSADEDRDVGVTVEREGPKTENEDAVKGTDAGTSTAEANGGSAAAESTTSQPDESTDEEPGADEEEAEAGQGEPEATEEEEAENRVPAEAVDVIKGIGPTYADRLSNAGIEDVDDLAAADADAVAEEADVPKGRLEDWIERAKARSR